MSSSLTIHLATGLVVDPRRGLALVVRKFGTGVFMQPGGKIEPGETGFEALRRELFEEIGVVIFPQNAEYLGKFTAPAANEPGHIVHSQALYLEITGPVQKASEIEEIRWIDPANPEGIELAPLSRDHMMPIAVQRLRT